MVNATINGIAISVEDGTTILEAARKVGVEIPTLCYLKEVNEIGACRVCVVEVEGQDRCVTACNNVVQEGMVIRTNTRKVRTTRKTNVKFILSQHDYECASCVRSGNCSLQKIATDLNVQDGLFEERLEKQPWDKTFPLIRQSEKCIKCMRCVQVCDKIQSLNIWDLEGTGSRSTINVTGNRTINEADCSLCGQCITHCPVGALHERDDTEKLWRALADPNKTVVVQVAPAVRAAWGEDLGFTRKEATIGKIFDALKKMGADYVFDSCFTADLTIMEETAEFLDRIEKGEKLPLLTSCCPAWVKFITDQYQEFIPNLSTCRSPQGMMSAVIKEYFRDPEHAAGKKTIMVSVMPCTAKKAEAVRPNSYTHGEKDTDIVITTTELIRMIDNFGLDFASLDPEACDMPFGFGSGGGVIFGVTGGVTEAVLRRLTPDHSKETMREISECGVRGDEGIKEFSVPYKGMEIKICVASGLANARIVMDRVKNGEAEYHLIEVMACRRGCIMGGGQPTRAGDRTKYARAKGLYNADNTMIIKKSDENPLVQELYAGLLKGKEHELLHNEFY